MVSLDRKKDEEMDINIKYNLSKHKEVPEKIDNLFNNFIKENEKMEEKKKVEEVKANDENIKVKKPRWRKLIGVAACFIVLFAGANIYATTQGYDNIFFLIKHVAQGGKITDKNVILSDRDVTISYNSIDIGSGVKVQVNHLTVKDNKAKLYLTVDTNNVKGDNVSLNYLVKNNNGNVLVNENSNDSGKTKFEKVLILDGFKDETKILDLTISLNNMKLSTLKIDLDKKEIEIDGEKELEKISEAELKQYLSAFALLDYSEGHGGTDSYIDEEYSLLVGATIRREILNTTNTAEQSLFEVDEMNEIVKSFTNIELNDKGEINTSNNLFKITTSNGKKYYEFTQSDSIPTAICLSVDNITYENGIYNVDFTYCFPTMDDYANDNIENIKRYSNTIKLKINTSSEYSRYFIEEIGTNKIVKQEDNKTENKTENETVSTENSNITPSPAPVPTPGKDSNQNNNDTSKIDNYTTSMLWGQYRSAGLLVTYPLSFTVEETTDPEKGNNAGELYATISGTALGKQDGVVTNTNMKIRLYEPEKRIAFDIDKLRNTNGVTSNSTGEKWYQEVYYVDGDTVIERYTAIIGLNYEDGSDSTVSIEFEYSPATYKAINIINYMLGELRIASY